MEINLKGVCYTMKLGVSTYSLSRAIRSGEMDVLGVMEWIKELGGQHVEIVPIGFDLQENPELIDQITAKAKQLNLEISNYAIGANFVKETEEQYRAEIEQVKRQVDIAHKLGVKIMRHDAASRPVEQTSIKQFEEDLPKVAQACREIADYAAQYGITTSVENHGRYLQASDRVQRLIHEVDRPNFKTTIDVGNFLCVDEDPVSAVKKNLPYTSNMIHLKDFYYRPAHLNPGEGWILTSNGNYLRGAVFGHGDIDVRQILKHLKHSGYEGYLSLEFEGMEECKRGTQIGFDNIVRLWEEV